MGNQVTTLTDKDCWELLRSHEFGRLAFHLAEQVHITPLNYAVDHNTSTDERSLLFRTAEGNKLFAVVMNGDCVFEIDDFNGDYAWSVIVRGVARKLEEHEEHRAENVPLRSWVGTDKPHVVEIKVTEISGRRFDLSRPWTHMLPPQ